MDETTKNKQEALDKRYIRMQVSGRKTLTANGARSVHSS